MKSLHSIFVVEEKATCAKHIGCRDKAEQSWGTENRWDLMGIKGGQSEKV